MRFRTHVVEALLGETRYEYEGTNQVRVIDGLTHTTTYEYDDFGRRTAIIDVRLWHDDAARPVAQASVTYMLPPG